MEEIVRSALSKIEKKKIPSKERSLHRSLSSDFDVGSLSNEHESFVPASSLTKRRNKGQNSRKKKRNSETSVSHRRGTQDDIQIHSSSFHAQTSSQSAPSSPTQNRRNVGQRASTGNITARSYSSVTSSGAKNSSHESPLSANNNKSPLSPQLSSSSISNNNGNNLLSNSTNFKQTISLSDIDSNNNNSTVDNNKRQEETKLDREIQSFFEKTRNIIQNDYQPKVEEMIRKITIMVVRLWEGAKVEIYGSYATSLCIPSSDVDLVVFGANTNNSGSRYTPKHSIQLLAKQLSQSDWITNISIIESAKVPVIKLISNHDGISISADISFNEEVEGAPVYCSSEGLFTHCGIAARELIKGYIRKMPEIIPLALVLKQFLHEKSLNNAFRGGLSSYCLVLMLISFLLAQKKNGGDNLKPGLGSLLLQFLNLYGKTFDYEKMGVTVQNGGGHFELDQLFHVNPGSSFVIVDPFNPTNNLGLHAKGIWSVKAAFAFAHESLFQSSVHLSALLGKLKDKQPHKTKGSVLYDALNLASNANGHPDISQHLVQQKAQEIHRKNGKSSRLNHSGSGEVKTSSSKKSEVYSRHHMDVQGHTYSQKDNKHS
eukprot:TRINITY_DN1499_c1_g2_i2.p1 TRINITY_DN1499_c1_g2~~TRINITY_DN1499_c1_g2_i2.p1  ORF type:complete len:600 (+),score=145.72 TRINITY_DN1499_c1_g2_i2:2040-3839(+)